MDSQQIQKQILRQWLRMTSGECESDYSIRFSFVLYIVCLLT